MARKPPARASTIPVLAPENLPYQMFLLVQQMTKRFQETLDPHGITPLHWGILCCLWREDGLRTSELGSRLDQLGGTITVGLDAMEKRGLIRRKKDRADGRISRIFLSKEGRSLQSVLIPQAETLISDMFSGFSEKEYGALSSQIQKLRLGKPGDAKIKINQRNESSLSIGE